MYVTYVYIILSIGGMNKNTNIRAYKMIKKTLIPPPSHNFFQKVMIWTYIFFIQARVIFWLGKKFQNYIALNWSPMGVQRLHDFIQRLKLTKVYKISSHHHHACHKTVILYCKIIIPRCSIFHVLIRKLYVFIKCKIF